jgi:hypothetical protein
MFARYLLGDLFIHGIGGAKYDELGDSIARRFFGVDPPGFLILSMTLWLGLDNEPSSSPSLDSINHEARELFYNPDRNVNEPIDPEVRNLIRAKHEAIAADVTTRSQRISRFRQIRAINEALQPRVSEQLVALRSQREQAVARLEWNRVARHREFPFVIHSAHRLRDAMIGLNHHFHA